MSTTGKCSLLCAWLVALLTVSVAFAQPPGSWGGPPGGRPSWGGPPGGAPRPGGHAASPVDRMMFFMRQIDQNHNGQLEEDELQDRRGYFARRLLERAGVKSEFPIHLSRVEEALKRAYASREQGSGGGSSGADSHGSSGESGSSDSRSDSAREPAVPGFGGEAEQSSVPGFGTQDSGGSSSGGSTGRFATGSSAEQRGSGQRSSGDRELEERYRRYAEGLLRQYDRNHNGRLERDEWRHMRGDPERADQNNDGVITREELTARLMSFARRGYSSDRDGGSRDSPSRDNSDRDRSRDRDEDQPRLRFLTAVERLPDGLYDWFYEKDVDTDGQVSMAEFTTNWTEAKVEEFFYYDLNRDGIITPEECLAAMEAEED